VRIRESQAYSFIVLCQIVNAILYSVLVLPICLVKVFETISYITLKRYFNTGSYSSCRQWRN